MAGPLLGNDVRRAELLGEGTAFMENARKGTVAALDRIDVEETELMGGDAMGEERRRYNCRSRCGWDRGLQRS